MLTDKLLVYVAILCVGVGVGMASYKYIWSVPVIAKLELDSAKQMVDWQTRVAQAEKKTREKEGELQLGVDNAREKLNEALETIDRQKAGFDETLRKLEADRSRLRVDRDRLHNDLVSFASASGRRTEDTIASCQDRASRLADLLAESAGLVEGGERLLGKSAVLVGACAVAADQRTEKLKACLDAWPK